MTTTTERYAITKDSTGWNVTYCDSAPGWTTDGRQIVTRDTLGAANYVCEILGKLDAVDVMLPNFATTGNLRSKVTTPNAPVEELRKIERALDVLLAS